MDEVLRTLVQSFGPIFRIHEAARTRNLANPTLLERRDMFTCMFSVSVNTLCYFMLHPLQEGIYLKKRVGLLIYKAGEVH